MPPPPALDFATIAKALAEVGRWLSDKGWVPATSGNFSARVGADSVALTRSGVDKGELTAADIIGVPLAGPIPPGTSAETALHLALYRHAPNVGAVLHTHSQAASVLSRRHQAQGAIALSGWEMQKAFAGQTTHEATLRLPIFPNTQDIPALALKLEAAGAFDGPLPGFLLAGHGLYAWGASLAEARRHVTAFEFLLSCELDNERIRP